MPLYLFLIGGVGIEKTFREKVIFQMLMQLYDAHNTTDPLKPKALILTYIVKTTYDAGGTTIHYVVNVFQKFSFPST